MLFFFGIYAMYSAFKPVKLELRPCSNCHIETEQFQSGKKFKEGFKYKWDAKPELLKAVTVSYRYTCERCGQKMDFANPDYDPDIDAKKPVICNTCGEPMKLLDRAQDKWGCFKDDTVFYRRENKIAEHAGLEQNPKGESGAEEKVQVMSSTEPPMMFCRECGAKIPRDSKFCKECGAKLV
jgi:ribosomal protein L40E/DNA-directed RNA polymerase subunit RPC12/RpoP